MSEAEGKGGAARLRAATSLREILEVATEFERTAHELYKGLVSKVSKPMRELVQDLAEEEAHHYQLFKDLATHPDVHDRITDEIRRPPNDHRFADYAVVPDLGEHPDDQTVLQYAMGRERAAMEQYRHLAAETPPGPAHDLFLFLAAEETKHKGELEKRYYEIVYGRGA